MPSQIHAHYYNKQSFTLKNNSMSQNTQMLFILTCISKCTSYC